MWRLTILNKTMCLLLSVIDVEFDLKKNSWIKNFRPDWCCSNFPILVILLAPVKVDNGGNRFFLLILLPERQGTHEQMVCSNNVHLTTPLSINSLDILETRYFVKMSEVDLYLPVRVLFRTSYLIQNLNNLLILFFLPITVKPSLLNVFNQLNTIKDPVGIELSTIGNWSALASLLLATKLSLFWAKVTSIDYPMKIEFTLTVVVLATTLLITAP